MKNSNIPHLARKKCSTCNGKGFNFDGRQYQENKWGGYTMVNVKQICAKCRGRGVK